MCKGSPRERELYPAFDRKNIRDPLIFSGLRPEWGGGEPQFVQKFYYFLLIFYPFSLKKFSANPLPSMNPRNANGYVAKNVLVTMLVAGPSRSAAGKSGIDFLK